MTGESRPAGPVRLPGPFDRPATVWIEGTTEDGLSGLAIDRYGRVCYRCCQVCLHRLDDVDGLGTHPLCDPDGAAAERLMGPGVTSLALSRLRGPRMSAYAGSEITSDGRSTRCAGTGSSGAGESSRPWSVAR